MISVIVAVYKAENYIRRCLDSIRDQTFTDFEVLMIDDGSPDRSGEICEEYSRRDSRFLTFHQENRGVGAVRHFGINQAKGIYSIHVDPDDWIEPDMFEQMYNKITETNTKICICNIILEYDDKTILKFKSNSNLFNNTNFNNLSSKDKTTGGLCNKLIETKSIQEVNLQTVMDLKVYEDTFLLFMLSNYSMDYCSVEKVLYHYDQYTNNNSLYRFYRKRDNGQSVIKFLEAAYLQGIYYKNQQFFDDLLVGYANEESLLEDIDRNEFIATFKKYFKQIFLSKTPLRRKLNIISTLIGTQKLTSRFYKFTKNLYYNRRNKNT